MAETYSASNAVTSLTVSLDGRNLTFKGREAWALHILTQRGERGATPIDAVGPRWSHYIWKIRAQNVVIETISEKHAGPFSGTHGRYVLRSPLTVVRVVREGEAANAAA